MNNPIPTTTSAKTELAEDTVAKPAGQSAGQSSYGQILKSSALIGGSSVFGFAIGAIRTKAMSVLLGPAGFGLSGLFTSIQDLARCLAAMGITTSGVRQIAAAVGSGEEQTIARTVIVLRRITLWLGLLAAVVLALFARPIAEVTFKSEGVNAAQYAPEVALLGLVVMLFTIAGGQDAIIQGTRRINNMAFISIVGSVLGVGVTVPTLYFLGARGIVPSMVMVAAISCALSWWFGRRVRITPVTVTVREVRQESAALFKLGLAFLGSGMLTMGAGYAIRTMVSRMDGLDAAGFYQSAWALAGMYATVVLQAMGADFYPRLTGVANDNAECNRLVNEQAQVSLLLSGPGLIATLTLAPLVIAIFYTPAFTAAVEPLRWICLGMALRVLSWPLGFVIVAKAQQVKFMAVEILATVVHVGLAYLGVKFYGVNGAGMAFLGLYMVHACVIYWLVHRTTGFRWSPENIRVGSCVLLLTLASFLAFELAPFWPATVFGLVATVIASLYALRRLTRLVPLDRLPGPVRKIIVLLRIAPAAGSV
jgi:antigen flippase